MPQTKQLIYILLGISVFPSIPTVAQPGKYEIESILLDCLTKSYDEQQVDINKKLDDLENYLIENEFLQSSSGQSYFNFYNQIVQLNDISVSLDYDSFGNIYKLKPGEFYRMDCLEKLNCIEKSFITNSKYVRLTLAIQQAASGEISPSLFAKVITSVLDPADFDHPFYRALALLAIAYTGISNCGDVIPFEYIENEDSDEYEIMTISTTGSNLAVLNGRTVSMKELKKKLTDFIQINRSKHLIQLQADKRTSYGFYLNVQDQVLEVYDDLRNDLAVKEFNKPFSELKKSQQDEIISIYPKRIKESINELE